MERHTYIRIAKIDDLVRKKRFPNCPKLAEEFEVSERTVLRDIEAMKDSLGAPIRYSKEKNGYYYEEEGFSLPAIRLTEGEVLSIFLGTRILESYRGTPFRETVERAFQKIRLLLPDSVSMDLDDVGAAFSFGIEHTADPNDRGAMAFDTLSKAIKYKKTVQVQYHKIDRDVTEKRILDPYHLRHTLGAWYLIAYSHARKAIRTFAVNRIKEIKVLDKNFEFLRDFSAERMFADSWRLELGGPITKVKVKFHSDIAPWIRERRWHPSQETTEHDDGSVTLTFKVAGTWEIKRWIMSFGSYAKVLDPEELREEILEEARWILKQK